MESNEMELFFEYMMNDPTTSPLRYGEAVENAFTTWLSIFTSAYNNQLLKKFFKSIYDTFIIVYPLFNINKTNINKKIADKINTIATVEEEGEEVEDSDDGNNIDEEDDEGIVESSLNASTTQVASILAKKHVSEFEKYYSKPCQLIRKKLSLMNREWILNYRDDLWEQYELDVMGNCQINVSMFNGKHSTLFDVQNVLNMYTGKCFFYYIHDYIYKKCFEFFSAPSRIAIAVQLAENSQSAISQLDQLKLIQLNDYFFNEVRRFTIKKKNINLFDNFQKSS
jgi:hypothetical protein